jgi:Ricin-type beta-trefoil lectin domain-like
MSLLSGITRTRTAVLTLAIGTAALTAAASPAMAATSPTPHARPPAISAHGNLGLPDVTAAGTFNLYNPNSDRCIGINTSGYAGIWNCTSNPDQTWHWQNFISYGGLNWAELANGNNMCLGVSAGSTSQGARIRDWQCTGVANEYWTLSNTTSLAYIYNLAGVQANGTGGVSIIGVGGGATTNGASLVLWAPLNHPDQAWYEV